MRYLILMLALILSGCTCHIDRLGPAENIDIRMMWDPDASSKAEVGASKFEGQINKQFDSNIKMPRLPFVIGRQIDSVIDNDGIKAIDITGEF